GRIGDPVRYNVFMSQYWYDEAGNRIRKEKYQWILTGGSPDLEDPGQAEPVGEEESGSWVFVEAVNYIRDIAGREIAIYSGNTLQQCTKGVPSGEYVRIRQCWQYKSKWR
ncbi:MAG: hypothetical protein K8I03_00205, partial [Ignavibacteria bacterium]|nr:hypothetical protein [Ignavibacteria bacterium]